MTDQQAVIHDGSVGPCVVFEQTRDDVIGSKLVRTSPKQPRARERLRHDQQNETAYQELSRSRVKLCITCMNSQVNTDHKLK